MKRIVICYDGTWNALVDPDAVTNVVRLGQAVRKVSRKDSSSQMVYSNAGVGSGGPLDRFWAECSVLACRITSSADLHS
jgi:uncharacterized protein (DUF2235 family)